MDVFGSTMDFARWLQALGGLRTFWTKPIKDVKVSVSKVSWRLNITWKTRYKYRQGVVIVSDSLNFVESLFEDEDTVQKENSDICYILVTTLELNQRLYDRWSVAYVYTINSKLLEPNRNVEVEVYEGEEVSEKVLKEVEHVQRGSWSFYIPPLREDIVFLARLHNKPVGAAYYNPKSSNIDYGIHVIREYWRRRISTRLLHEMKAYAENAGMKWLTVIRVLRGRKPTASDRRAMAFYEANNPMIKLNIYRIKST